MLPLLLPFIRVAWAIDLFPTALGSELGEPLGGGMGWIAARQRAFIRLTY
jgi:hypothetical protein